MRFAVPALAAVAVAFALAGCGGDGEDAVATASTASSSSSGMVAPGGGLSVVEAISTDAEPPLAVSGWVVGSGADVRLCSGYKAGASKPCEEPSLALKGAGEVTSGTPVSLLGAVEGNTFVVSSNVQG